MEKILNCDGLIGEKITRMNFGIKLIQKDGMLPFGTDALLLSAFARTRGRGKAADFGTGSGIVALICAINNTRFTHIDAVERSSELSELSSRNVELNQLGNIISCIECDIREYRGRMLDCVMTNPPYMRAGSGIENKHMLNNDARREHYGTIDDFVKAASRSLAVGGKFFAVYRPERLPELLFSLKTYGIEPKILIPVSHTEGKAPSLILVEGVRGAGCDMKYTKILILSDKNGKRSSDAEYIYENCLLPQEFFSGR